MPILSTIGGASLRSFGRGIEQVQPALPAHSVLLYNVTNSTTQNIPSGWQTDTTGNLAGKFIVGTAVQGEIGTYNATTSGTANAAVTTSIAGDHIGSTTFRAAPLDGGSNQTSYSNTTGGHQHSGYTPSDISNCTANTNAITVIFGNGTSTKSKIPPNTVVWRKVAPTSLNFTEFVAAGAGYFYAHNGKANTAWTDNTTATNAVITALPSAGTHNHSRYPSYTLSGSYVGNGYAMYSAGAHTDHGCNHAAVIYLKSKALKAWSSPSEESVEYGMIVMYYGDLTKLPAGWRVCNGLLGTPDMHGYHIPNWSGLTHGAVVESSSGARLETQSVVTSTASSTSHTHQGAYTAVGAHDARHPTFTWNHSHTVTVQQLYAPTSYTSAHYKLAFIQYKGI